MAVKKKFPYRSALVACNGGCQTPPRSGTFTIKHGALGRVHGPGFLALSGGIEDFRL